jgi:molybdopterin synthase catalytic subunit
MIDIKITNKPLQVEKCFKRITSDHSGCVNIFIGTVRAENKDKKVHYLEFESYEDMAINEIKNITNSIKEKFNVKNVLIHHRLGKVEVGEAPVIIAISASHRKEAIEATNYAINTFKKTVPIWKKEVYGDGEAWVSARP